MARVCVVGAGISGLAVHAFLDPGHDVTVLEASGRPGGNVRTVREDGWLLDVGPNGWLDDEPAMGELLARVGLADRVVPASGAFRTRWIFADGRAQPAPLSPPAFLTSALVSWRAKLRLALEPFLPRGRDPDETLADFVRRRLGAEMLDRLVAPMAAGIYAADPEHLSLRAAFPRMAALEREHRSLFLAMLRLRRGGAPSGHLTTLTGGVGTLTEALAGRVGTLRCGARAIALERRGETWRVQTEEGSVEADHVVLACPGYAQAPLLAPLDPEAAAALRAVPYAPLAVVCTGYPSEAFERPPEGFGVLVARGEDVGVLGCLYTSRVFPDQVPDGGLLLRTMIGGATDPDAAGLDDQALLRRTEAALARFASAPRRAPAVLRVFRHPRGIPQYTPGHLDRVAAVRRAEARWPGLHVTGNHLEGIGVKDCARAAQAVAARIG